MSATYLMNVLFGPFNPPKASAVRKYRDGKLVSSKTRMDYGSAVTDLLFLLRSNGAMTAPQIQEETHRSQTATLAKLRKLVNDGRVIRTRVRATYYYEAT